MDINNARNNLLQRRSKLLSEGLSKNDKIDSSNEDNAISSSNNIETQSSKILNQENYTTSQKMVKNRRIGDFIIDDSSDISEMLDIINSDYEEEWENTEEEYNFYNENLNNIDIKKDNNELYNNYDNIGSIEEYTKDDNFMLDENEYLAKKQKYEDDENDADTEEDNTEDNDTDDNDAEDDNIDDNDTDDNDTDDDDPEFRDKYKEIFELNKQKLSKKAKNAVEEDEKEMTSIIKTFKEKKIKSSRKSLDLKKLRGTFREEELEMNK